MVVVRVPNTESAPPHQTKSALRLLVVLADNWDLLSWRDIPTRRPGHVVFKSEVVPDVTLLGAEAITAAHRKSV
jgi:hypothetical protein